MLRTVAIVAVAALAGAVGVAETSADTAPESLAAPAYGALTDALVIDDVWAHADRAFAAADLDGDGVLSVDEYAGHAVSRAALVRFEGVVAIDGRERVHVGLAQGGEAVTSRSERAAIDAVARAGYYDAIAGGPLTRARWVASQVETFGDADWDADGRLAGRELDAYAGTIAFYPG